MQGPGGELDRREREVLRALVHDYIQTGEPVASGPLLSRHELDASPATIRSVMSDLEALGFLEKPHASSGRIPTERGYRLYVDTLLKFRPPSLAERDRITTLTTDAPDVSRLLEGTADLLHSLSHHAGVVTTPRPRPDPVRQLEFVRLRENRLLAVFVSEAGIVTNKLVQLEFPVEAGELDRAAAYLNERILLAGAAATSLDTLRERILEDMRADHSTLQGLMQKALRLAEQAFAEKDRILRVLDRVLRSQEVQIFIGAESEFATVPDVSVVAAPYGVAGQVLGTLAVVGPTRMNFARVIPLVDLTARELSRALAQRADTMG